MFGIGYLSETVLSLSFLKSITIRGLGLPFSFKPFLLTTCISELQVKHDGLIIPSDNRNSISLFRKAVADAGYG